MMNLRQALEELEKSNKILEVVYNTGNSNAFIIATMACRKVIWEHGEDYITSDDIAVDKLK